jgi:hypothetical protein
MTRNRMGLFEIHTQQNFCPPTFGFFEKESHD